MNKQKGFTLIELAIVLVIMGLLVSAALGGKELLKAASLKGVIAEVSTYKIAVDNFKQQYEGLPGDLKNATSFWTSGTNNGNGDGRIGNATTTDYTEVFYAWQHLALAQMISGTYSGSGAAASIGVNVAKSKHVAGAGYSFLYFGFPHSYVDAAGKYFPGNYIYFGSNPPGAENFLSGSGVNPDDAYYIDNKIDDGTPDFGNVMSSLGGAASGTCTTGSAPDILYNFSNSGISCKMTFTLIRD